MPRSIRIEGRTCRPLEHLELESHSTSLGHTAVIDFILLPFKVRNRLVEKADDVFHCDCKGLSREVHRLIDVHSMVKPRHSTHVPEHFKIGKSYYHLRLRYPFRPHLRSIVRYFGCVFNEKPRIAYRAPVRLRAEFIGCIAVDRIGIEGAVVVELHRTVADIVTETLAKVGERLEYIASQLVVQGGRDAVRKVAVGFVEHFVGLGSA